MTDTSPFVFVGSVALGAVILLVGGAIYNVWFHPLAHIPGPPLARATPIPFLRRFLSGYEHLHDTELFKNYGPLVRTAPDLLAFNDPSYLPLVYHRTADKGPTYNVLRIFGIVGTQKHADHQIARRRLAASLTGSVVRAMTPIMERHVNEWIGEIKKHKRIDFRWWSQYLMYDILAELCFGKAFGFVKKGKDIEGLIESFDESIVPTSLMLRWAWFTNVLSCIPVINRVFDVSERDKTGVGAVMRFSNRLLEERINGPIVDKPDFLNNLLSISPPMDSATLKRELLILMIAGNDTTSVAFRSLVLKLYTTPYALEKVVRDGIVNERYLSACLKETLRFYPPVLTPFPRLSNGVTLGEYYVPPGTEIYASSWCLHRHVGVFGPDAGEWRPERWLEASTDGVKAMERGMFAFGYGPRTCLGKAVGEQEVLIATKRLLEECDASVISVGDSERMWGIGLRTEILMEINSR